MAAGYLAKYATKSTEATGHSSTRLTGDTIDEHADATGDHIARLIDACWRLGRPTNSTTRPPGPRTQTTPHGRRTLPRALGLPRLWADHPLHRLPDLLSTQP